MTYKIISAMKTGEFQSKFGTMVKYAVQFEGEDDAVEIVQKPTSPVPSGEVSGTIETTQYGRKFKRDASGGFQGGNNPQRQSSIEWQSARRDAVDYCIAKSRLLLDLGKKKDAEEELSGKHIFEVALYFKGIETGATQLRDKEKEAEQEVEKEDAPVEDNQEEIPLEDIPF